MPSTTEGTPMSLTKPADAASARPINDLVVADATHNLICRHKCGNSDTIYAMPCIPLGTTKSGNIKALVFGRLFWADSYDKKQIRYAPSNRVLPK